MIRPTSTGTPITHVAHRQQEALELTSDACSQMYENPLLWVKVTPAEDEQLKFLYAGSTDWSRVVDYSRKIWWRYNIEKPIPSPSFFSRLFGRY